MPLKLMLDCMETQYREASNLSYLHWTNLRDSILRAEEEGHVVRVKLVPGETVEINIEYRKEKPPVVRY